MSSAEGGEQRRGARGGGRSTAAVTIRDGITYINSLQAAQGYLKELGAAQCEQGNLCHGSGLVRPFLDKARVMAAEVGSQIAVTNATGVECRTKACQPMAQSQLEQQQFENTQKSPMERQRLLLKLF